MIEPEKGNAFAKGADVGWLSLLESIGMKWQNDNGVQQDALQILKDHGINSIRLRVLVHPPKNGMLSYGEKTSMLGFCDMDSVVSMAVRASNMGFRIMIDFHYSDKWADDYCQTKPAEWAGHSFSQLQADVYDHTLSVMTALKNAGVNPDWVQVGNEIDLGMLLPDGSVSNFDNLAQLINQGYNAVKAVNSDSKVIVHLAAPWKNHFERVFFDGLKTAGANWDICAYSYYPYWGAPDQNVLSEILNDTAARYEKPVMVVETGGREDDPPGTYRLIKDTIKTLEAVPNGRGLGVFYWEPEANSQAMKSDYVLGACSLAATNALQFTSAIDAFIG